MLGAAFRYALHHPGRIAGALASDPAGVFEKLQDSLVQRWEYRNPVHRHEIVPNWKAELHRWLGVAVPCGDAPEFDPLWAAALAESRARGIEAGPESFAGYNDGDPGFLSALWCLVRHLKPFGVVETGVGHGFSSRVMLEGMARNRKGCLYSIDRPPLDPQVKARVGIAVPASLRGNWELIEGSSRRCLPALLSRVRPIDLFVHDSLHTRRNLRFELRHAWAALRPGGVLVVDDVDSNGGYSAFLRGISGYRALVCEAEPVRPDERRFNRKGLFALVLKDAGLSA